MTNKKEFYTFLVEATENDHAFVQVFWAWGHHLGEAVDLVMDYTRKIGIENPNIAKTDPFAFEGLPTNAISSNCRDIYYADSRNYFPVEEYSKFQLPYGVILSCIEGDYEFDTIKEGFTLFRDGDIQTIEIVVDRVRLQQVFDHIVNMLPSIKACWIKLMSDWEPGNVTEIYATEQINTLEDVNKFILETYNDIFLNGHTSLTIYSDYGATNLVIDDNKKVLVLTKSDMLIKRVSRFLTSLGFRCFDNDSFRSIQFGFYHWHYRPANSKSRHDLIKYLKGRSFFLWKTE